MRQQLAELFYPTLPMLIDFSTLYIDCSAKEKLKLKNLLGNVLKELLDPRLSYPLLSSL